MVGCKEKARSAIVCDPQPRRIAVIVGTNTSERPKLSDDDVRRLNELRADAERLNVSVYELVMSVCHARPWKIGDEHASVARATRLSDAVQCDRSGDVQWTRLQLLNHLDRVCQEQFGCVAVSEAPLFAVQFRQMVLPNLMRPAIAEACHIPFDVIDRHAVNASTSQTEE